MKRRFLLSLLLFVMAACAQTDKPEKQDGSSWRSLSFSSLPFWQETLVSGALPALAQNCSLIERKGADALYAGVLVKDWGPVCSTLESIPPRNEAAARAFIENSFSLYMSDTPDGAFFTAYYEPLIEASRTQGGAYQTPLYQKPRDLLTADLGLFDPSLKGRKITGKINGSTFVPYDDRASIAAQGLKERAEPLLFVKSPVDAFFLEIQGSGLATLASGETVRVAYDGQNGRPYTAIGKTMAEKGLIERPVTMQKIKTWLRLHPDLAGSVMDQNRSYVFFRFGGSAGAKGAQSVILTPGHSLAVDPAFLPLGSVLLAAPQSLSPRIMVAQDTGGAIKGPLRGDIFMGSGPDAEHLAGSLQDQGSLYLLWPKKAAHAPGL